MFFRKKEIRARASTLEMDCSSEEEKLVSNDRGRPLSHSDNNSSVKKALSIAAVVEASAAVPQSERIPPSKAGAVKRAFSKRASPLPFSRFFQLAAAPATLEKATLSSVRAQEAQQDAVSLPLPPPPPAHSARSPKSPKAQKKRKESTPLTWSSTLRPAAAAARRVTTPR